MASCCASWADLRGMPFVPRFDHRQRRPTFAEWITRSKQNRTIEVFEHPTEDFKQIPSETLDAVTKDIRMLVEQGWTVILVDSGGETRTKRVCSHLEFVEDSRKP
jgi:hypothetical protein